MNIKLLKLLSQDSRTSTAELATMLGMSEKEVCAQIAEMEREGVIRGYKAVIDWDRLDSAYVSSLESSCFTSSSVTPSMVARVAVSVRESLLMSFKSLVFIMFLS